MSVERFVTDMAGQQTSDGVCQIARLLHRERDTHDPGHLFVLCHGDPEALIVGLDLPDWQGCPAAPFFGAETSVFSLMN